jgi:tetratricopeptide (TPR) repeat protein
MRRLIAAGVLLGLCATLWAQGQTQAPPQQSQQQPQPAAQPPAEGTPAAEQQPAPKPPRQVGRPGSQEERDAWIAIERAQTLPEKAQLAESFLAQFPDSGLTPFAHQLLAFHYQQANDYDNFVLQAEKTLEELPDSVLILASLAGAYAQKGEADKAIDRAQRALRIAQALNRPPDSPAPQWALQIDQLLADAHYAIGTAFLAKYNAAPAPKGQEDPNLKNALDELQKAVDLDPAHDRAYLQLGFAYAKKEQGEKAIESFASAAAVGGALQSMARSQLEKLYQFIYRNTDGLDQAVARQKDEIQRRVTEKQAFYQSLAPAPTPTPAPSESAQPQP